MQKRQEVPDAEVIDIEKLQAEKDKNQFLRLKLQTKNSQLTATNGFLAILTVMAILMLEGASVQSNQPPGVGSYQNSYLTRRVDMEMGEAYEMTLMDGMKENEAIEEKCTRREVYRTRNVGWPWENMQPSAKEDNSKVRDKKREKNSSRKDRTQR